MRRISIGVLAVLAVVLGACSSGGVSQAEYDLLASELTTANQDLAATKEQLAGAVSRANAAEEEAKTYQEQLDELLTIDEAEEAVMERQQALGVLGNLFVEFRSGPWDELTVTMFEEFIASTGNERLMEQLDRFATALAEDPDSDETDYEYGVLGFDIMLAIDQELVDPHGQP